MKVSNETKIGALATISITILILGYNYMKGKELFSSRKTFYAVYTDIDGLTGSNPVQINGYKVGQVKQIIVADNTLDKIIVKFEVDDNIAVTKNTVARIFNTDLFGAKGILLTIDKKAPPATEGDTLPSELELVLSKSMGTIINPVKAKAEKLMGTLDSVLSSLDDVLDDDTQKHLQKGFRSLAETLENFRKSSEKIDRLVDKESAQLDRILANVESITRNLKENNQSLSKALKNVEHISDSLAASSLKSTINNANAALAELNMVMKKINNGEGSIGLLVNDKKLYNNLESSARNLDALLIDLKAHPKRYVHFSIFGKKDKASTSEKK